MHCNSLVKTVEIVLDEFPGLVVDHYIVTDAAGKRERHNLDVALKQMKNSTWLDEGVDASDPHGCLVS